MHECYTCVCFIRGRRLWFVCFFWIRCYGFRTSEGKCSEAARFLFCICRLTILFAWALRCRRWLNQAQQFTETVYYNKKTHAKQLSQRCLTVAVSISCRGGRRLRRTTPAQGVLDRQRRLRKHSIHHPAFSLASLASYRPRLGRCEPRTHNVSLCMRMRACCDGRTDERRFTACFCANRRRSRQSCPLSTLQITQIRRFVHRKTHNYRSSIAGI